MDKPPIVFISYSWTNENYIEQIRHFAERLRHDGVEVILDQWDLKAGHDKYFFMESSIDKADKVLVMCDHEYEKKANNRSGGVGTETSIITEQVYKCYDQEKFIPIIIEDYECLPIYLKSRMGIDLREQCKEKGYEKLLREIYDKPAIIKPNLGKMPDWLLENPKDTAPQNTLEKEVLSVIGSRTVNSEEIAKITGRSINTIRKVLRELKNKGYIVSVGKKYAIETRKKVQEELLEEVTTDDEKVVLLYFLENHVRKVTKNRIIEWLIQNEIHNIDVDNAFDLLSHMSGGEYTNDTLALGMEAFRHFTKNAASIVPILKHSVDTHIDRAYDRFVSLFKENRINAEVMLFVAYIIEEQVKSFGDRWMAKYTIEDIKRWESAHVLEPILSNNYGRCLSFFEQNQLVYESGWTEYNNPREYTLYSSMKELFTNCPASIQEEYQAVKKQCSIKIPF